MTRSLAAARGPFLLIAGIFVLWQGFYWATGDVALRSPVQTFAYAADLFTRPTFWPNLQETLKAFVAALAIAVVVGISIGLTLTIRLYCVVD